MSLRCGISHRFPGGNLRWLAPPGDACGNITLLPKNMQQKIRILQAERSYISSSWCLPAAAHCVPRRPSCRGTLRSTTSRRRRRTGGGRADALCGGRAAAVSATLYAHNTRTSDRYLCISRVRCLASCISSNPKTARRGETATDILGLSENCGIVRDIGDSPKPAAP